MPRASLVKLQIQNKKRKAFLALTSYLRAGAWSNLTSSASSMIEGLVASAALIIAPQRATQLERIAPPASAGKANATGACPTEFQPQRPDSFVPANAGLRPSPRGVRVAKDESDGRPKLRGHWRDRTVYIELCFAKSGRRVPACQLRRPPKQASQLHLRIPSQTLVFTPPCSSNKWSRLYAESPLPHSSTTTSLRR